MSEEELNVVELQSGSGSGTDEAGSPDTTSLDSDQKINNLQQIIDGKVVSLAHLAPDVLVEFSRDPYFSFLKIDKNHTQLEQTAEALARLEEFLALEEMAQSARELIEKFNQRVGDSQDPLVILGLNQESIDSKKDISEVFKALVKLHSPDLFDRLGRSEKYKDLYTELTEIMKKINTARDKFAGRSSNGKKRRENTPKSDHEYKSNLNNSELQNALQQATTIAQICEILEILSDRDFTFIATKGGAEVKRYPWTIIRAIENAQIQAETGNLKQAINSIFEVSSLYGIRDKVLDELTSKLMAKLSKKQWSSVEEIVDIFKDLSDLEFQITAWKDGRLVKRYPQEILNSIKKIAQVKDQPSEVHALLERGEVTALFNIDLCVYREVRDSWNWITRKKNSVPESFKARFEAFTG